MKIFKKRIQKKEIVNDTISPYQQLQKDYRNYWLYTDIDNDELEIIDKVKKYTMTSPERMVTLIRAIKFIINNNIEGDFVECGVWKGGSMMIIALVLKQMGVENRKLYLYDTFEGMTMPTKEDISLNGEKAIETYNNILTFNKSEKWCFSSLDEVKNNLSTTNYEPQNLHFIKGRVEETIPKQLPNKIALLRLDTDWFESTYHEMIHLFPIISNKGFLIIDDFGHWKGSKKAIEKYFNENKINLFLNRVDYSCRLCQKINK